MLDQFLSVFYGLQTDRQAENYKGEVTDRLTIILYSELSTKQAEKLKSREMKEG